jgi:hypothetical protein
MAKTTFSGPVASTAGFQGAITPTSTTTAELPAAADNTGALYFITDNGVGSDEFALVVSDGTDWVKVTTTALT